MDITMEIRKLPYSNVKELSMILELNDSWKNLMAIIPKQLEKENYECDISRENPCKYHSEHFKILENASITMKKMCTELLFNEWGTSAKIRPALGHLLYLLTKAQLYRAADYVAQTLLKRDPPARPTEGPAATVKFNTADMVMQKIDREMEAQKYHSSIISNLSTVEVDVNIDNSKYEKNVDRVVPKIVISEPERNTTFGVPIVVENKRRPMQRQDASIEEVEVSDLMKFSHSTVLSNSDNEAQNEDDSRSSQENTELPSGGVLPDMSAIMLSNSEEVKSENIPNLSILNSSSTIESSEISSNILPSIGDLMNQSASSNQSGEILPNLSVLGVDKNNESIISQDSPSTSTSVPQFSALLSNKNDSKHFLPISSNEMSSEDSVPSSKNSQSQNSSDSQPKCSSPLPNLQLNTPLPHYPYCDIQISTNDFDEMPHKNCRQIEKSPDSPSGRFLGSGAFGQVFLALGIGTKPVAVKKLFLNNLDVVGIDDPVTKQFTNEVEVLSRYKHENLLSLVGYSCDGPTYCLLYEFMPGGALKDKLQEVEEKFIWTDRLYIALGTARAISHLHTAYSTPLIHRDVKTANILLDCTNKPKLCDFGLIKLVANQNTNTSTSAFGTSAYMAREAFRGDVSVKLDTYSFGVVLLELITGLPPLDENREGCDIVTHVEEVCEDDSIAPLIDFKAGSWVAKEINFAEELYKIAVNCLEHNKKKRPTMTAVTKELAELIKQCT